MRRNRISSGIRRYSAYRRRLLLCSLGSTLCLPGSHRGALFIVDVPDEAERPELLDKVTAYIEEHYAGHIAVRDIARKFYVSESSISHQFKQKMGISIYHYVTQRRLISAKNLISRGMPLEQVASQVGFADYSAFYRAFKQEYGISPRQYRNMQESGR